MYLHWTNLRQKSLFSIIHVNPDGEFMIALMHSTHSSCKSVSVIFLFLPPILARDSHKIPTPSFHTKSPIHSGEAVATAFCKSLNVRSDGLRIDFKQYSKLNAPLSSFKVLPSAVVYLSFSELALLPLATESPLLFLQPIREESETCLRARFQRSCTAPLLWSCVSSGGLISSANSAGDSVIICLMLFDSSSPSEMVLQMKQMIFMMLLKCSCCLCMFITMNKTKYYQFKTKRVAKNEYIYMRYIKHIFIS